MSFGIKLMMVSLVLGMAGLFVIKKPDGTPWLTINEFLPNSQSISVITENMSQTLEKVSPPNNDSKENQHSIYRWRDNNGNWQFSDKPPEGVNAQALQVSGNLNRDLAEDSQSASATDTGEKPTPSTPITAFSNSKIQQLIEDTHKAKQLMENRESQLEQIR